MYRTLVTTGAAIALLTGVTASAETRAAPLHAGPERPVTAQGELVPVEGAELAVLTPDFAIWSDPRAGSTFFHSENPTGSAHPTGSPIDPLREYRAELKIAEVGGQYLMIASGSFGPDHGTSFGFHSLPLDSEGVPLRERPEKIWVPNPENRSRLVSRGQDALLVWTEGNSLRTLQIDRNGSLLEWSAPAEPFAGRIVHFDVAPVGEGYVLVVVAFEEPQRYGVWSIQLTGDGEAAQAPNFLFQSENELRLNLAGGSLEALLVWPDRGLNSVVLDLSGAHRETRLLVPGEDVPYWAWSFAVTERENGWAIAWAIPPVTARVVHYSEIDSSGQLVSTDDLRLETDVTKLTLSYRGKPILGVTTTVPDPRRTLVSFHEKRSTGEWAQSTVSGLRPQRLAEVAASHDRIAVLWLEGYDEWTAQSPRIELVGGSIPITIELGDLDPIALASDGRRFMITTVAPIDPLRRRLDTRWIEPDGAISEPSTLSEQWFAGIAQEWSGTQMLTYWSDARQFKLTLIPGDIHVSSLFPSAAVATRPFWLAHSASIQDVICGESGCIAAWIDRDYSNYCDFCIIPGRSLIGRVNRSGDLLASPEILFEAARAMRLIAVADVTLVVSRSRDELFVTSLDRDGQPGASRLLTGIAESSSAASAPLGKAAVVVWEAEGDILGAVVMADGAFGSVTPLASSSFAERNPRLVVLGGRTLLIYERVDEQAGFAPRLFMRELSQLERRRAIARP